MARQVELLKGQPKQKLGHFEKKMKKSKKKNGELTPSQGRIMNGNEKGMNIQGKMGLAPS